MQSIREEPENPYNIQEIINSTNSKHFKDTIQSIKSLICKPRRIKRVQEENKSQQKLATQEKKDEAHCLFERKDRSLHFISKIPYTLVNTPLICNPSPAYNERLN